MRHPRSRVLVRVCTRTPTIHPHQRPSYKFNDALLPIIVARIAAPINANNTQQIPATIAYAFHFVSIFHCLLLSYLLLVDTIVPWTAYKLTDPELCSLCKHEGINIRRLVLRESRRLYNIHPIRHAWNYDRCHHQRSVYYVHLKHC